VNDFLCLFLREMFGTQTRVLASVAAVLLLCSVATFAADIIVAEFTESRSDKPNATNAGMLYYYYDGDKPENSRLRFEYNLPGIGKVSKLYHYAHGAIYSMCPGSKKCTGLLTSEIPDPWYETSIYTKGASMGNGLYTYTRAAKTGQQVKSIVMTGAKTGKNTIAKIVFADKRTIDVKNSQFNPSGYNQNSTVFLIDSTLTCPKAECPLYADIVFVLDNSGSIDNTEWKKMNSFVKDLMDKYEFGTDKVESCIIQFGGNYGSKACTYNKKVGCSACATDYSYTTYAVPNTYTATIIAGKDYGKGLTVSTDRAALKKTMDGSRPRIGGTCQGFGLELAMQVLDRSPRQSYARKPYKIIIGVTDGEDLCPNRTANAAKKLRETYGAFVIEVGVGIPTCGNSYYKQYLKDISSKLGSSTDPAYFDVKDFDAIKQMSEKLFKPICDGFAVDCKPDCLSFCACGECVCDTCNISKDTCYSIGCKTDSTHSTSTGCALSRIACPIKDDACTTYACDGSKKDPYRCTAVANPCTAKKNANPGTCREVYCSLAKNGCYVQLNNAYCQTQHGNACLEYECTPEGQTPEIASTGCRLKSNKTKTKEDELKKNGKSACFSATCDPITGVTGERDTCVPTNANCYSSACKENNGKYSCQQSDKNRPAKTKCTEYECKASGWTGKAILTKDQCISQLGGADKNKCNNVFCNDTVGCQADPVPGCEGDCTSDKTLECIAEGAKPAHSSVSNCVLGVCVVKQVGSTYKLDCDYTKNHANCLQTMAKEVERLNKENPDKCYTPACGSDGRCTTAALDLPDYMPTTKCMKAKCERKNNGEWYWNYLPTAVNESCKSDPCTFRECRNDADETLFPDGCYKLDLCTVKTTPCVIFTCDTSGKTPVCKSESAHFEDKECGKEICVNDKKVWEVKNLSLVCTKGNKCEVPYCDKDGNCQYLPKEAEDDDPCKIPVCDPATGSFTYLPKCDDGLYCTEDTCTASGECKYEPVLCEDRIPMDGYPCFEALCKEGEKDLKCVRKLIRNAYIDVCGNCIVDKPETGSSSSSETPATSTSETSSSASVSEKSHGNEIPQSQSSESVDLLECTGAPARPILTEGLAAASIALIIIAAVVIGCAITASGILGTKALIDRARMADNQSAHSNPLYQNNEAEMNNPAFQ